MLYKKNKYISNIFSYINETIDNLLGEQLSVITLPDGAVLVKKTVKVVDINYSGVSYEEINGKDIYYIKLDDVKKDFNKPSAEVGDEFEIEMINFDDNNKENLSDYFISNKVSPETLQKIYTDIKSGKVIARKIYKIGTKPFIITTNSLMLLGKVLNVVKKKKIVVKDEKPHSLCYCLTFTEDGLKEDLPFNSGEFVLDRDTFESNNNDQTDLIIKKLLDDYDFCVDEYGKYIKNGRDRIDTKKNCSDIESWYTDSESLMDDIIANLKNVYDVKGYKKDLDKTKKEKGGVLTIGETLSQYSEIEIDFENDVKYDSSGNITLGSGKRRFDIVGTFRENRESTLLLYKSGDYYVFGFKSSKLQNKNNGGGTKMCKNRKCEERKKNTDNTTWSGTITELK